MITTSEVHGAQPSIAGWGPGGPILVCPADTINPDLPLVRFLGKAEEFDTLPPFPSGAAATAGGRTVRSTSAFPRLWSPHYSAFEAIQPPVRKNYRIFDEFLKILLCCC